MFQSPCGDYVSGKVKRGFRGGGLKSFSPLAGIMLAESSASGRTPEGGGRFQSPCGDYVSGKLQAIER